MRIAVITPTTGSEHLARCVQSVQHQHHTDLVHYVVVDGDERRPAAQAILDQVGFQGRTLVLPEVTGANQFYGHRIYGALGFLVNADYVAFLDEDNWLQPEHFSELATLAEKNRLDWAYALRNIVSHEGEFICADNCQSLGWWPAFDGAYHFVDTSCYLIRAEVANRAASLWNQKGYQDGVRDPDRELCRWLLLNAPSGFTTGSHTVNYRLGESAGAQWRSQFFQFGNQVMNSMYRRFPWKITAPNPSSAESRHLELMPIAAEDLALLSEFRNTGQVAV